VPGYDGPEPRVSTGIASLDGALGELYWGDNVVWELDGVASAEPFYRAILGLEGAFDLSGWVAVSSGPAGLTREFPQLVALGTPPGAAPIAPAQLLREIRRQCDVRRRTLLLFDSLDAMVDAWGAELTRGFFSRCCPMLLELGAIAYWTMDLRRTPEPVQEVVEAVTQCVLCLDRHSVRIAKAEGRDPTVTGSLLHWDGNGGRPVLTEAEVVERVAASLRAVRRPRGISQGQLAELAGVTASAISQAERAERGLSLATLVRLSARLGVTLDELLAGDDPSTYRIGRRTGDPRLAPEPAASLVGVEGSDVVVDLVHLGARERGTPATRVPGRAIVAVSRGLVQVRVGDSTPAIRDGEVLLAESTAVRDWRNLGDREAVLFWIVMRRPDAADGAGLPG
jgi:transcriptional regulator with XRE-family HTH domain